MAFAGYMVEHWRGQRAMDSIRARYAAAGISLNVQDYLPPRVEPEENFCATPLLDGIAQDLGDASQPGWEEAKKKQERLRFRVWFPAGEGYMAEEGKAMPWQMILDSLGKRTASGTGARIGSPRGSAGKEAVVAAASAAEVYAALEKEKAVFDELITAAMLPKAVFTPQPADGYDFWKERSVYFKTRELRSLLHARIAAAAETGRHAEAAALANVLCRLREARVAEAVNAGYIAALAELLAWCRAATDILACDPPDQVLRELLSQVQAWDAEGEYRHGMAASTAAAGFLWTTVAEDARWTFRGNLRGVFEPRGFMKWDGTSRMLVIPSGWLLQSGAQNLQRRLDYLLNPVLKTGLSGLPAANTAFDKEWADRSMFSWFARPFDYGPGDAKFAIRSIHRMRLTMLALAMERHRKSQGCYPLNLEQLVPSFLSSIPPDVDGAPLRAVVSDDGQNAVIYSIGWNLKDDWRGNPPEKAPADTNAPDWMLRLPLKRKAG